MSEKIKTDSEEFQRAVARGDRAQIEEWDAQGLIEWDSRNFAGRQLSEQAQQKRKAAEEAAKQTVNQPGSRFEEAEQTELPSRLDNLGVGKDERLWSGHRLVQRAIRQGDSVLLAEIYADPRYESAQASGPDGAFTSADIAAYMDRP
ncbi:MAG: hypothetical protein OEM84_02295 [Acidimicrobiia bacterium]|nr:hypothetical protein [Acidimicrobiia bacterium]